MLSRCVVAGAVAGHSRTWELIAIFTVLGLVLFGGGAYAIFDGWPYLVLERGFTQVIIGSIASTAGLILLSLTWVLKELKGVRESLLEASEARLAAPVAVGAPAEFRMPPASMPVLVPAAVSAAAAGAVAEALSAPALEETPATPKPAATDFDLFGDLVARRLRDPAPEPEDAETEIPAAEGPSLPDMFARSLSEQPVEPHDTEEPPVAVSTESHEPAEIVSAKVQPISEDEALAHSDDFAHFGHLPPADHEPPAEEPADLGEQALAEEPEPMSAPEPQDEVGDDVEADVDATRGEEFGRAASSSNLDDFSALRESLTGHLRQSSPESERVEPAPAPAPEPEADPFAVAESWMDRASPRKEPWFEAPLPANEPEPSEVASPLWPAPMDMPRFGAEVPEVREPQTAAFPGDAAEPEHDQPVAEAGTAEPEAEFAEPEFEPEGGEAEEQVAPPEPAASEEGVVGAYQVGDAHFTIFADGSIRARTPDGEYSFASMDELKVYLASEKSRLGG